MERRGVLVRSTIPTMLRGFIDELGLPDRSAEGSDGAGRKALVPWARLYSPTRSPRASDGWYLVYLFSEDGQRLYLSLNQGTTQADAGYRGRDESFLSERVTWARGLGQLAHSDLAHIKLGERTPLSKSYEAGHVAGIAYARGAVPTDDELASDLQSMLRPLEVVYEAEDSLSALPAGFGPGLALFGFAGPVEFTLSNTERIPNEPGVHVVWSAEGELLFAGMSRQSRGRVRQHLSGDRTSSILREKVSRRLAQELGDEPSAEQVNSYLSAGTIAWRSVPDPDRLKARIMDELRPTFNDVRPAAERADAKVLAVYVGQKAETNLQTGLEARTWGFREERDDHRRVDVGDWLLLGSGYTGGSPRTPADDWSAHGLDRVIVGRIVRSLYQDSTPLWPDEKVGSANYPHRLEFELVENLPVDFSGGLLGADAVEAIRRSALDRGLGYLAPAEGTLFERDRTSPIDSSPSGLDEICFAFSQELANSNLQFGTDHDALVRAFVVSLATKRLLLLTGLSGSGKTRIALGFGQWLGPEHYAVIPVRPDWTGPEPLLGYEDALIAPDQLGRRGWNVPAALRFMLQAAHHPHEPHLLVLDEMNLAHVERYFADLLSGMESEEPVLPNLVEDDKGFWRVAHGAPDRLPVPRNLLIAGTVNVDETTYLFSPKVLDRANTLEFRVQTSDLRVDALPPTPLAPADEGCRRGFLIASTDLHWQARHPASNRDMIAEKLTDLHEVLSRYGFEFGHRVFFEALRFASLLEAAGESGQWAALDLQVLQKVLPRLHGSTKRLAGPLSAVARFAYDLSTPNPSPPFDAEAAPAATPPALPLAFDKARRMQQSLRVNQFASFSE
jgi:5-methylcytosine-specific restriction protein B